MKKVLDKKDPEHLDLTLKRLDTWVKAIAIVSGIFGLLLTALSIWNLFTQRELSFAQRELAKAQQLVLQHQAEQAEAKKELNLGVEVIATPAQGNEVNISMRVTNYSVRTVHISMLGMRIWKKNWTSADDIFEKHPELLIYSASKIVNCPANICPRESPKSRLIGTQHRIILGPVGGAPVTESFGTVSIPKGDLKAGVSIQAIAYLVEGIKEECTVVSPPRFEGAFPVICEVSKKDQTDCGKKSECAYEEATQTYPKTENK